MTEATLHHPTCKKLTEAHTLDAVSWPFNDERADLREAGSPLLSAPRSLGDSETQQVLACCQAGACGSGDEHMGALPLPISELRPSAGPAGLDGPRIAVAREGLDLAPSEFTGPVAPWIQAGLGMLARGED